MLIIEPKFESSDGLSTAISEKRLIRRLSASLYAGIQFQFTWRWNEEHEQKVTSTTVMHYYSETYSQIVLWLYFRLRVSYLRVFLLFSTRLYRVLVVDVCTGAWCYVFILSNLRGFVYKLSLADQFLCPLLRSSVVVFCLKSYALLN